jgi:hypothetical protein
MSLTEQEQLNPQRERGTLPLSTLLLAKSNLGARGGAIARMLEIERVWRNDSRAATQPTPPVARSRDSVGADALRTPLLLAPGSSIVRAEIEVL